MRILFGLAASVAASAAFAESFDRPIPQAQSATAEFWYVMACITLFLSLVCVHWLVSRR